MSLSLLFNRFLVILTWGLATEGGVFSPFALKSWFLWFYLLCWSCIQVFRVYFIWPSFFCGTPNLLITSTGVSHGWSWVCSEQLDCTHAPVGQFSTNLENPIKVQLLTALSVVKINFQPITVRFEKSGSYCYSWWLQPDCILVTKGSRRHTTGFEVFAVH